MAETYTVTQSDQVFSEFHTAVFSRMINTLTPLIGRVEGEEIAQEALLKVFLLTPKKTKIEDFRLSLFAMKPLVFVIAKNMALSRIRHNKVRQRFVEEEGVNVSNNSKSIESNIIEDKQTQMLLEAVNQLPPICRQVFIQRKLHGKSHADIAQMLQISHKTVENHLAKGLKLCRQYMIKQQLNDMNMFQKRA